MNFLKKSSILFGSPLKALAIRYSSKEAVVIVHGGCGAYSDEKTNKKIYGCKLAAKFAYDAMLQTGCVTDAVETAISFLEDDPDFNCGYGSVLTDTGEVEMDASIVHGKDMNYGGVFVVKNIAHPISLARLVMEKSSHCLLTGNGALQFANEHGMKILPPGALVSPEAQKLMDDSTGFGALETGTVGCCALDLEGNLAAGTSTGGLNNKLRGRCGDTGAAGAGTYADNTTGAVSSTGHGETCVKVCLTYNILNELSYNVHPMDAATDCLIDMHRRFKETAGVIVLTKSGDIAVSLTAPRMAWACCKGGQIIYGTRMGEVLTGE